MHTYTRANHIGKWYALLIKIDIVEIDFPIPGKGYKVHPALIVSNDDLQLDEGFAYVALISSQRPPKSTRRVSVPLRGRGAPFSHIIP